MEVWGGLDPLQSLPGVKAAVHLCSRLGGCTRTEKRRC